VVVKFRCSPESIFLSFAMAAARWESSMYTIALVAEAAPAATARKMVSVVCWDHSGSLYGGSNERCIKLFIKLGEKASAGSVQLADHRLGLGRSVKIFDSRGLTQEFGIRANTKVNASLLM
jgi:hypothetical protein